MAAVDFYSVTLALAMLAAAISLGLAVAGRLVSRSGGAERLARPVGLVALTVLSISGLSHLILRHSPGSSSVLGPAAFLGAHPALLVTAAAAVLALALPRIAAGRR